MRVAGQAVRGVGSLGKFVRRLDPAVQHLVLGRAGVWQPALALML